MKRLTVYNPFNAPVYHEETVGSTMDVSRILADQGELHGTVIAAGYQEAGRGRIRGRSWEMKQGSDLPFTILLRYPRAEDIPPALTLKAGLAAALAIEDFAPVLAGKVMIKWPNDILLASGGAAKKVAGILAEADGGNVHIGIGVNVAQMDFPEKLQSKATSIGLAAGNAGEPLALLEMILARLYGVIEKMDSSCVQWKSRIEARLYKKGEKISFAAGAADSENIVSGTLFGIGEFGELMIVPEGETAARFFTAGEIKFY